MGPQPLPPGDEATGIVSAIRSLETAASYGSTESGKVTETLAYPPGIFPDVGALSVIASTDCRSASINSVSIVSTSRNGSTVPSTSATGRLRSAPLP